MAHKYIFSTLIFIILFIACEDIPRDNVLDPGNPDSYQTPVILLEAFVNTANPYNYNDLALQALDSIKETYKQQVLIAEYHRDASGYHDSLSHPVFDALYEKYVNAVNPGSKGVPDIFVNGTTGRVQGPSSINSVFNRLNIIIADLVVLRSYFTLEPVEVKMNGSEITASCKIARLGRESSEELLLKMISLRRIDTRELERVVITVEKSVSFPGLEAGEIVTKKFNPVTLPKKPDYVLFILSSADELTVYQTIKVIVQ